MGSNGRDGSDATITGASETSESSSINEYKDAAEEVVPEEAVTKDVADKSDASTA